MLVILVAMVVLLVLDQTLAGSVVGIFELVPLTAVFLDRGRGGAGASVSPRGGDLRTGMLAGSEWSVGA